jgi:iron complex transport system permease protein
MSVKRWLGVLALLVLLGLSVVVGVMSGPAGLTFADVWRAVSSDAVTPDRSIVLTLRLPRVAGALLTGASLAVSGAIFQALLRNPLAEPYLLGVSSGAALGAVGAITLGLSMGPAGLAAAAFVGSLVAIGIVFRVARVVDRLDTRVLILAGVVVAAFFGAGVMLLLTLARSDTMRSALLWTMGSLSGTSWSMVTVLAVCAIPASVAAMALGRDLNALALGEETAAHLGTTVERTKTIAYVLASLLAATAVSVAGVIGFVGLVVPHAARILWGADHRILLPISFAAGGALLVLADAAARSVASPLELPVGVVTALLGVPFFLVLLRRNLS